MPKYISLIKANMTEGMNIFKVSVKNKNSTTKIIIPAFLSLMIILFSSIYLNIIEFTKSLLLS